MAVFMLNLQLNSKFSDKIKIGKSDMVNRVNESFDEGLRVKLLDETFEV